MFEWLNVCMMIFSNINREVESQCHLCVCVCVCVCVCALLYSYLCKNHFLVMWVLHHGSEDTFWTVRTFWPLKDFWGFRLGLRVRIRFRWRLGWGARKRIMSMSVLTSIAVQTCVCVYANNVVSAVSCGPKGKVRQTPSSLHLCVCVCVCVCVGVKPTVMTVCVLQTEVCIV